MPYHYSAATPTLPEDTPKPSTDRPTIQLIVNTKLGEDIINLNEVTDSEYESSVWVSRRQVTVLTEAAVDRGSKMKKASKCKQSISPERRNHGSKVKAAIQGALKGARRKKTTATAAPTGRESLGVSTIPVRDKKVEKHRNQQQQQQHHRHQQPDQETQIHTESHI